MTMPSEGLIHGNVESRRASKPLIEKRRRARINQSLAELKSLVIDSKKDAQTQNARPPKLEKADILEMTVAHLKNLHQYLEKSAPESVDSGFKAGFSKCLEEICHFIEKEATLSLSQKNKLLSHLTNITSVLPLGSEHVANSIDDTASSYSGNSSRSNTPSSAVNDPASMEYLPCSPYSDSTHENSSNSSLSPPSSTIRTISNKNFPSHTSFPSNVSVGNRSNCLASSSTPLVSNVGVMEADSTSYNVSRPLNLASSSRTHDRNVASHGQYRNLPMNRVLLNKEYARSIGEVGESSMEQHHDGTEHLVFGNGLESNESVLMQIEPVWRPW